MEKEKWELEDWKNAGAVIGRNVTAYDSFIDRAFPWLVEIGDNTVLTGATVLTHDGSIHADTGYSKTGVTSIGKGCFLGYGSIILAGVKIGDRCRIGAGAVVSKDVPANSIVVGYNQIIGTTDKAVSRHLERMKTLPCIDHEVTDREEQKKLRELIRQKGGYAV